MDAVQSKERGSSEITQPPDIPIGNIQMLYAFFFFLQQMRWHLEKKT